MTAGKIILSFKGNNSNYLCGNPNIDFWKKSYQRYTNFSMQSIELDCEDKIIPKNDEDTVYRFKIHRYADLIDYIYLTIDLPTIYSNINEFKWIDYLGCGILNYARLYHDSNLIEEIDGKYLYMFNELYNDANQKKYFNRLIGNIAELNDPYINGLYKSYSKFSHLPTDNVFIDNVIYPNKNYNTRPSIENYQLNIPLIFSCFRNNNNLPLISLGKTEVFIEISIKSIKKLYTIVSNQEIKLNTPSPSIRDFWNHEDMSILTTPPFRVRKRHIDSGNFSRFTSNQIISSDFNFSSMKPRLNANYIFLDNKERNLFATLDIQNLELFNDHVNFFDLKGLNHLNTQLYHPIKNFIVLAQRNDVDERNEWMNFTNLDSKDCNPLSNQTQILDYIRNEALDNNDEMFKYFGSFINLPFNDEQTIISNHNISTNFNSSGFIDNVTVNKSGDYFIKVPEVNQENVDNILTTGLETNIKFNMQHAVIYESGEYKSVPTYNVVTDNDGAVDAQIELQIKDDKLYSVDVLDSGTNYDNIIEITLNKTYNIDEISISNKGTNYSAEPLIYIYPLPNSGYNRENISNLNISDAKFSSVINDGKIDSINIDNIGNNYNNEIASYKVYIGDQLKDTNPVINNSYPPLTFTQIPNIHFHDGYNEIIKPIINTQLSSGNLNFTISNLDYENSGNYGIGGNKGYGLTNKTKIRTGKVIDTIDKKIMVSDFKIKNKDNIPEYVEPSLKFVPKEYITSPHISKTHIDNIFTSNTFINPNLIPILSGDSKGQNSEYKINFFNNVVYNGNNTLNFDGSDNDNVFKYPVFNNVVIDNTLISNMITNNTLILDYQLIDNTNTNSVVIPNNIINDNINTAVFYIHFAENITDPIYSNLDLQIKSENLIPNHYINSGNNVLSLEPSNLFSSIPFKILKDNVIIKNLDITDDFDGFNLLNYTDIVSDKLRTSLLFYVTDSNTVKFEKAKNIYQKNNEVFKLFINDIFIDAIEIKNELYLCHKGINHTDIINTTEIVSSDGNSLNSNKNALLLSFGNFKKDLFSIEIGKKIKDFEFINQGHSFKTNPSIGITNANGINKLDFRTAVIPNANTSLSDIDAEFKPIIDYGGTDAEFKLEISNGGTLKNLKPFVNIRKLEDNTLNLVFNNVYYGENVYNNIFNDSGTVCNFKHFGSDKDNIFINYQQSPFMFLKHTDKEVYTRSDYEDIIVEGVLDYGGCDGEIKIDIDHGGTGGLFEMIKDNNINDANNVYYNINIKDSGIGYKDLNENVAYLLGSVIKYNKFNIEKATIIRQYNLKTQNGLITPYNKLSTPITGNNDNKLYLGSRIYQDKIVDNTGIYVNNFRGICFVDPGEDGSNNNFVSDPNVNYSDGYDRIKLSIDTISDTDPNKDKLIFFVGGIVDTDPIIVNKGSKYGTEIDDDLILQNLQDINNEPHIYSSIFNGFDDNTNNIVRFSENEDITIRTSIKDNKLDDCIIDILIKPEYLVVQPIFSNNVYNTTLFTPTSIEPRHYYPNGYDLRCFDSHFYLYKASVYSGFQTQFTEYFNIKLNEPHSNTIDNVSLPILNELFIGDATNNFFQEETVLDNSFSVFNRVTAHSPWWGSFYSDITKGFDVPSREIDTLELINSDFLTPGNPSDFVKFNLKTNIPTPSDFYPWNYNTPNMFDILNGFPGDSVIFTDNIYHVLNGPPVAPVQNTPPITLYNKLPLISFDEATDTFNRIKPTSKLGSQLTSFKIRNNPLKIDDIDNPNQSLIDNYVSGQADNVIIYNNLINKIELVNSGIGYYRKNRDSDKLVSEISDGNKTLFMKTIVDNEAEPAQIDVEFNEPDENGLSTIKSVKLKIIDGVVKKGKDYNEAPEIYFIDFEDNNNIYRFGVFSRIDFELGFLKDEFVIEPNFKIPSSSIPFVGGKITDLSLYNYYKIPIKTLTAESSLLHFLSNNILNYHFLTELEDDYINKYIEPYFFNNNVNIKIGGNITSVLIINGGENYRQRPIIYASYFKDNEYILDDTFNIDAEQSTVTYNNVNGSILSLGDSNYLESKIEASISSELNDKFILKSQNVHNSKSLISNGGQLKRIFKINTPNSLNNNYNYTKYSKINIGISIDDVIIDDIGSEIDDNCNFDIKIEQFIDNVYYYHNYPKYISNLTFKGSNINTNNILLTPNLDKQSNGYDAVANINIHTGKNGKILTLCGIDNVIIDNAGNSQNNSIIINNGSNKIISNTYKWSTLDKSILFDSEDYFTYEHIRNFNKNWIYRDSINIPNINSNAVANLYDSEIITNLEIFVNNKNREYISDSDLYKKLDKYEFWSNSNNNELLVYSFSLDNNSDNPKGACNFSSFKDLRFKINLKDMKSYEDYRYNLSIYFEYYNVKQYMNGIGAIKFAN